MGTAILAGSGASTVFAPAPKQLTTLTSGTAPADNTIYELTLSTALSISTAAATDCAVCGAHIVLSFGEGGSVTATYLAYQGDDITTAAEGEVWEISILRGRWLVKKMSEAAL